MNCGNRKKRQDGSVEVEAVFILPIAIISVVMLIYLSLFMFQRANLQAALETALIYYKPVISDTYVTKENKITYKNHVGSGLDYEADQPLSPYRGMFGDGNDLNDAQAFRTYMESAAGNMLFGKDIEVSICYENNLIADSVMATACQTIHFPLKFELLSMDGEYELKATARVSVVDHDMLIRNADYGVQLLSDTKLGEIARNFKTKVSEAYSSVKEKLGSR